MNLDELDTQNTNDTDEIARRYDNRPGFELVSVVEVGLPVTKINLTALTLVRKPIPPIEEFILKAINIGLSSLEEISYFLGLEELIIKDSIINLRQAENIDLIASLGSSIQEWKLTKKGKTTLEEARIITPEERGYQINFDKMLWKPRRYGSWEDNKSLLRHKNLKNNNIVEIPYYPARTPELADLNLKDVEKIIQEKENEKDGRRKKEEERDFKRDFIGLKKIERRDNFFQPALALVYKQKQGNDWQITFAIDGRISEVHESAFTRSKGPKKDRIIKQLKESFSTQIRYAKILAEEKFGDEFLTLAIEYEKQIDSVREEINNRTNIIQTDIDSTRQTLEKVNDDEQKVALEEKLNNALEQIKQLQEQLEQLISSTPIRFIKTYDHRPLFEEALKNSQKRLLIISPWIRATATNQWLVNQLEKLVRRGVKVFIGYGYGDKDEEDRRDYDIKAEEAIQKLAKRYPDNVVFKRLGDTHCKILISDQRFAIVGSFNWLSFKGDPNRTFRDERSTLVSDPNKIDELFNDEITRLI
ncbi:phospholipase D-like domain-containing protein [Anabaena cylindrica UHCC 0172]|uniref:phospholipase D-like domain-containing protein n=1 Tax=Anabaena cylindrica TaxID=1165 RepID=UPI002B208D33|nr:phospholipase D-like domain-containing protein [Anabaena cylindrica]MEA5551340.1 phospholipase D-like domain-containing protein [Anabaena cylindrica UHCC 0172]